VSAKLRIKARGIEIEWEGDVAFLKSELPKLVASIIEAIGSDADHQDDNESEDSESSSSGRGGPTASSFTTASAAAKLQAKSGADLFKAALARLQISEGVEPASRTSILNEMRSAPRFFKPAMSGNLTRIIQGLLDSGEINEPSAGNYVLSNSVHDQIVGKLNS
jgi:hypothetical protein